MSSIWEHYEKVPGKKSSARCSICEKEYSYKTTTSNLKKHLMYKHKSAYHDLLNQMSNKTNTVICEYVPDNEQLLDVKYVTEEQIPSQSEIVYESDLQTIHVDVKPEKARKRKHRKTSTPIPVQEGLDERQKSQIDKKLLEMIILDYQPFSIVENEGFKCFVTALNPNYELPTRKLISGTIIPEMYMECKARVTELVQMAQSVTITVECWTSVLMDTYIAVTAHFMLDFEPQTILLHCDHFSGSHTHGDLARSLKNIAREYNIEDKIALAVSHHTHDIKHAIEKIQWPFFGCFLHRLNLIVEEAFEVIDFIMEKVKIIVAHFKKSNIAAEALQQYQIDFENKPQPLRLKQSVPTRWNSVFYMLQRFLKLQKALQAVKLNIKVDLPIITLEIWEAIKQVCMILQPFEEATRVMSATQYMSASLTIVIVDGLKNAVYLMKSKSLCVVAKTFVEKLEDGLKTYFPKTEIEENILLGVCTLLDPRFKIHAFLDNAVVDPLFEGTSQRSKRVQLIKDHVLELLKNKIREKQQIMPSDADNSDMSPSSDTGEESISIWGKIDKTIAAISCSSDDISNKAKIELELFLNEEVVQRHSCPLQWWKRHALLYPNLADIFIEHYHIVVTSVQCSRAFSKAGNLLNEKRSCLSRKHTAALVFLNSNIALCK